MLGTFGYTSSDYELSSFMEMPSITSYDYEDQQAFELATAECEDHQCRCEHSLYWASQAEIQCDETPVFYYYHPGCSRKGKNYLKMSTKGLIVSGMK